MFNDIRSSRNILEAVESNSQIQAVLQQPDKIFQIENPSELLSNSDIKHAVIRLLLSYFKNDHLAKVKTGIDFLRNNRVAWSEIEAIERSLAARKPEMIKKLLILIKTNDLDDANTMLSYLRHIYPDTPELDVVKRALQMKAMNSD